ncbi:hypothetical protein BU17DRAFT_84510 [Hysterangium stoloniferum]|nr:hypothetical protein BU17DRAFT_84510 [Hysterangium stoloniferum]
MLSPTEKKPYLPYYSLAIIRTMNSFRSVLALLSIIGLVSGLPQAGKPSLFPYCLTNTLYPPVKDCYDGIISNPSIANVCFPKGNPDAANNPACFNALEKAGWLDDKCLTCKDVYVP